MVRFVVRWRPTLVWGTPAIVVVALLEFAAVATRPERTSLAGLLARIATVTRDWLDQPPTE